MPNFILTYKKIKFNPFEPKAEDVDIEDIAHSQSLMTRANGHIKHFYSVGQHCVICCKEAQAQGLSSKVQLACLLHDASESYLSDLTRPVKAQLPAYLEVEEKLQTLIFEKFGLSDLTNIEKAQIQQIDDSILYYELIAHKDIAQGSPPKVALEHDFSLKDPVEVENEFLDLYYSLTKKL